MTPSAHALDLLTSLELDEARLLSWGATAAQWSLDEVKNHAAQFPSGETLIDELLQTGLLVMTPTGGYRTRCAETIRLISALRQSFPSRPVTDGRALILDYRFLHRPRRRPLRDIPRDSAREQLARHAYEGNAALSDALLPPFISAFQLSAAEAILSGLCSGSPRAVMITAGTGSGKTLAFYFPAFTHIVDAIRKNPTKGVIALSLYPRSELLKDQLRTVVGLAQRAWAGDSSIRPVATAAWFSPTPFNAGAVRNQWKKTSLNNSIAYLCPFLLCPDDACQGKMVWTEQDVAKDCERLVCVSCTKEVDERFIRLTRSSARKSPPDIMLSTTESLNRQLANPGNLKAFGIRPSTLELILLDELHIYEGTTGAQNAYLFRRLRHSLGRRPLWVALSATLRGPGEFLSQCVNVPSSQVQVISPDSNQLEEMGAEYLLAVRHDPASGTGTLSTTIQTAMLLTRCLDTLDPDMFAPPLSSGGVAGNKVFAFTDKLDVTNRLYWDVMDAEGWAYRDHAKSRSVLSLAHLRSEHQDRMRPDSRESPVARDPLGQWWWLCEKLGHGLDIDRQLDISRTSSQDRGVNERAELIVATSTLEVGFDDDTVGAVIQHKAPHDAASFLQRKGRAGRNPCTRPWTVVVLSDWGRDRTAWDAYETLFDPELPPKLLPLDNRYVQRIQGVYILLEWISRELGDYTWGNNVWSDLTGPGQVLEPDSASKRDLIEARQIKIRNLLESVLVPGPARNRLRRYVTGALGLRNDPRGAAIVDSLLWDGPRPLLLAVVPTIVRRLRDNWDTEVPSVSDPTVTRKIPLRDFAPGNLFDDLLATDVSFSGPGLESGEMIDSAYLPVLRTLRDFMPGTVSRHFGVRADSKRHWIPVIAGDGEQPTGLNVEAAYAAVLQSVVLVDDNCKVPLFTPIHVALETVPLSVKDHSRVEPRWENYLSSDDAGVELNLPESVRKVFRKVTCHTHSRGNAVRQVRFARGATGSIFQPNKLDIDLHFVDAEGNQVALGQEALVDGIAVHVNVPPVSHCPNADERTAWLAWHVGHSDQLTGRLDRFERETLAWATEVLWSRSLLGELDIDRLTDAVLSEELKRAAFVAGRSRREDLASAVDGDIDHLPTNATTFEDGDFLESSEVLEFVRRAIHLAQAPTRTDDWVAWRKRRYTLTAVTALMGAMARLARGVDSDSLIVDLDADDDCLAWITETGPGGIGAIESFMRGVRDSSHLVSYALATSTAPSDLETLDADLVRTLMQRDETLDFLRKSVINAWPQGHAAALAELNRFSERLSELGVTIQRLARATLAARLLGPGTDLRLFETVAEWLEIRDRLREAGLAPNSRVLAAVLSGKTNYDSILQLPPDADQKRRSRAIANVMWPFGSDAQPSGTGNPYADLPPLDFLTFRETVSFEPREVVIDEWNAAVRDLVHEVLVSTGEVRLVFAGSDTDVIRASLLDLQVVPIEDGTMFVHPTVVAVMQAQPNPEVWLRLQGWYR